MWKQPNKILNILTKRKTDGYLGYDRNLPELRQIRNYKRNAKSTTNNEYEDVIKLINEFSSDIHEINDKQAFVYGVKMGTGDDHDPFICCFTSKYLLNTMSRYSHHHSVFHIDGTYKNIKNRFPVIAYGRSDLNGQLHLISVAIVSDETSSTYSHFYRLIFFSLSLIA